MDNLYEYTYSFCKSIPPTHGEVAIKGGFLHIEDSFLTIEGTIFDNIIINNKNDVYEKIINFEIMGSYNIIFYDFSKQKIYIKNDITPIFPLYIYKHNKDIIISNCIWNILRKDINKKINKRHIYMSFIGKDFDETATNFEYINLLDIGTIGIFDIKTGEIKYKDYSKKLLHRKPLKLSLDDAASMLDESFKKTYKVIKNKTGNSPLIFGNSGGLDSRLVPAYAIDEGINLTGFTVSYLKDNKGLFSDTIIKSQKIANYYNFKNFYLKINKNFRNRFLRILKIVGSGNPYKSTYEDIPSQFVYNIVGNPQVAAGGTALMKQLMNITSLEDLTDCLTKRQIIKSRAELIKHKLNIEEEKRKDIEKIYKKIFTNLDTDDLFSIILELHRRIYNLMLTASGEYESLTRRFYSFSHYIPYTFITTYNNFEKSLLTSRAALKELQKTKLASINKFIDDGSYNFNNIYSLIDIKKQINFFCTQKRESGLPLYPDSSCDYDEEKEKLIKEIKNLKVETFNELFKGIQLPENIMYTLYIKKFFHVVENNLYDTFDNKDFNIISRYETLNLNLEYSYF